jgi:hypothetical protein
MKFLGYFVDSAESPAYRLSHHLFAPETWEIRTLDYLIASPWVLVTNFGLSSPRSASAQRDSVCGLHMAIRSTRRRSHRIMTTCAPAHIPAACQPHHLLNMQLAFRPQSSILLVGLCQQTLIVSALAQCRQWASGCQRGDSQACAGAQIRHGGYHHRNPLSLFPPSSRDSLRGVHGGLLSHRLVGKTQQSVSPLQATAICSCEGTPWNLRIRCIRYTGFETSKVISSTSKEGFSYDIPSRSYPQLDP